ncbi:alanine--tRNA ligase [Weissella tructae]|uniref:Alanine--tRNA ligase n=2 Tax=Weissella TaxID=46255 RepID=A0A075U5D9_9LACO|nr:MULTISPECIES: alanine--tRNA ligase [Weissella]AIG65342.1 Alanine--tRNA ligase [Weissella tructae]AIM62656.1 Alanine--tRNA ligase [Weissella ceti]AIM63991.1 Alanine--tRNA ligase [Weissella ceti]ELA07198.1 alanyl-tRNA ligase [Weissella ceti NC36]QVV91723.1 alanine--tRNA ligase [Weissella tructae]
MKELSSAETRDMFLRFFESKGHSIEPSQPLIPKDDPTLLWINAGVATLKKYFDGSVIPKNRRITNAQKAIRTNDIENVGHTARHHTLFEMMGNFSIGDYFKTDAIPFAWELLTSPEWYDIDPEKLYVTVYPNDTEAKRIWLEEVGIDPTHVYEEADNFWDIGEGPSGPDTEIFFDRGPRFNAEDENENYPGGENDRYLEIWNIVFSQYNHLPGLTDNKDYPELPHKNIDTGMGLERLVSVFQNADTNFETDLFMPIIEKVEALSGLKYGEDAERDISFKVIADHARAVTFAIGDGALPSNEGRGYIIRRLLRRAVLHGRKLGIEQSFINELVPVVANIMQAYYPEVKENEEYIASIVVAEEVRFNKTLTAGLALLADVMADATDTIDGAVAFKMYDTYGFPYELTVEAAEEAGLTVDRAGFDAAMKEQQERARAARGTQASMGVQNELLTNLDTPSTYVGWSELAVEEAQAVAIIVDGDLVDAVSDGSAQVIFNATPFYAEMGGQVADHGVVLDADGEVVARVLDVKKAPNGQHLHEVEVLSTLDNNGVYRLEVDQAYHAAISKNHTATHMLDQAIRNILGEHSTQAGSLVNADGLRYDFTYNGAVPAEKLAEIEDLINQKIIENLPISWVETDLESAKKLGAVAVFTEKYGEKVRVVSIGDFNIEFDGGTHAVSTAELGMFKITSEQGTGAGIRRIEAVTGQGAMNLFKQHDAWLNKAVEQVKAPQLSEVNDKIAALQNALKDAERQVQALEQKLANQSASDAFTQVVEAGSHTLITAELAVESMDALRATADNWKQAYPSDVLVLAANLGDKVNLLVAASPDAISDGIKAGDLIKAIAPAIGGGGGGRPDMAQAGGKNPAGITTAFEQANDWLAAK